MFTIQKSGLKFSMHATLASKGVKVERWVFFRPFQFVRILELPKGSVPKKKDTSMLLTKNQPKIAAKRCEKKIAARFREDRKKLARCASYKAISLLVLVYWSLKFTQNQKKHEETNRNPAHPKAGTWLSYPSTVAPGVPSLRTRFHQSINPSGFSFQGVKKPLHLRMFSPILALRAWLLELMELLRRSP